MNTCIRLGPAAGVIPSCRRSRARAVSLHETEPGRDHGRDPVYVLVGIPMCSAGPTFQGPTSDENANKRALGSYVLYERVSTGLSVPCSSSCMACSWGGWWRTHAPLPCGLSTCLAPDDFLRMVLISRSYTEARSSAVVYFTDHRSQLSYFFPLHFRPQEQHCNPEPCCPLCAYACRAAQCAME